MHKYVYNSSGAVALLILLMFSLCAIAQAHRQVRPAFPINSGEQMLVIATGVANSVISNPTWPDHFVTSGDQQYVTTPVQLPVGTTIKRVLGEFVDQVDPNLTIQLFRVSNADMVSVIILRTFDTSGISSSSDTDFQQVVSNPLAHTMLQGWTYYVRVIFPGGTSSGDLASGVIKIIYEPVS